MIIRSSKTLSLITFQHPQLMSGEEADERKANAVKQSLDYLDLFLEKSPYVAADHLTIADFSLLASVTQLEGMEYKITAYRSVHIPPSPVC